VAETPARASPPTNAAVEEGPKRCPRYGFENLMAMKFFGQCATPLIGHCPRYGFADPPGFALREICYAPHDTNERAARLRTVRAPHRRRPTRHPSGREDPYLSVCPRRGALSGPHAVCPAASTRGLFSFGLCRHHGAQLVPQQLAELPQEALAIQGGQPHSHLNTIAVDCEGREDVRRHEHSFSSTA
jgi:hypothetical protein